MRSKGRAGSETIRKAAAALGLNRQEKDSINDDRVARMLDALVSVSARSLFFRMALHVIKQFEIDTRRIHHETTTITFHGQYVASIAEPKISTSAAGCVRACALAGADSWSWRTSAGDTIRPTSTRLPMSVRRRQRKNTGLYGAAARRKPTTMPWPERHRCAGPRRSCSTVRPGRKSQHSSAAKPILHSAGGKCHPPQARL